MQQHCPKCNYPRTHPFGLIISDNGCSGCVTHEEKNSIDWQLKRDNLEQELLKYKKKGQKYDCVVPVVGDAEDYFTLSKVLELGLSPLVVCVNDYFKNDIGWKNFHQLITHFDVDSFTFNPDIRVYKDLVRTSLRKFDHIMLPFLQLHTSFPVHVAYERNIPLVIWGQNQSVEQVGKFSHHDAAQMSKWHRKEHDLFSNDIDDLIGNGAQVKLRDLNYYRYPEITALSKRRVKGLYLSNFFRWDPLAQNKSVLKFGFQPEQNNSSFDIYERAGSSVYYQFHDLLKYKRIGYRKITDHVAREIRHKRLTIDEGIKINSIYTESKVHIKPFFDWLGVTSSGYEWFKKHRLSGVAELVSETPIENINIQLPEALEPMLVNAVAPKEHHVLFGKGIYI
jgi:N-acetyl sugar amidotransferase